MKSLLFSFFIISTLFFITTSSFADDFWDLPATQTKAQKIESAADSNNDIWALDSPDKQPKAMSDEDFWTGGGNTSLDDYIQKREDIRLAEVAKAKAAEEARRIAQLEQQREREAQKAEAARRQAQIDARRRQQKSQKSNNGMFGKMLAIGMGAVIADSSSLNSAAKADFLKNYSADVMNNDMSMSNTKQWKDKTGQTSNQSNSGGSGGASEVERNKRISSRCKQESKKENYGDGQSAPHCQLAIYNKCVADEMCSLYPSKCTALKSRVTTSCKMLSDMGDNLCPVCR